MLISLSACRVLHTGTSEYQDIALLDTIRFGKVMLFPLICKFLRLGTLYLLPQTKEGEGRGIVPATPLRSQFFWCPFF